MTLLLRYILISALSTEPHNQYRTVCIIIIIQTIVFLGAVGINVLRMKTSVDCR